MLFVSEAPRINILTCLLTYFSLGVDAVLVFARCCCTLDEAVTASREIPHSGSILKRQQSSHTRSISSGKYITIIIIIILFIMVKT